MSTEAIPLVNLRKYREEHPHCELARYFRVGNYVQVPGEQVMYAPGGILDASEIHHVVAKTPRGRTSCSTNILHLHPAVHRWCTEYSIAGRVLCCWELKRQGRLNWAILSSLDGRLWPGLLSTDSFRTACRSCGHPQIEGMRQELCT